MEAIETLAELPTHALARPLGPFNRGLGNSESLGTWVSYRLVLGDDLRVS